MLLALLDTSYYRFGVAVQSGVAVQWVFELAVAAQADSGVVYVLGGGVGAVHTIGLLLSFGLQVAALVSASHGGAQRVLAWLVFALTLVHLALQAVTWYATVTVYRELAAHTRRVARHLLPGRRERAQHVLENQVMLGTELVADNRPRRRRRHNTEYERAATTLQLEQAAQAQAATDAADAAATTTTVRRRPAPPTDTEGGAGGTTRQ